MRVETSNVIIALLFLPAAYCLVSYFYLAKWHGRLVLFGKLIHENGRLTLLQSVFYWNHFLACVPTVVLFSLITAGAFAAFGTSSSCVDRNVAAQLATLLLSVSLAIVVVAGGASVRTVGWQHTMDYALQRFERDHITSKGGTWNQLLLSNIPIALGAVGVIAAIRSVPSPGLGAGYCSSSNAGMTSMAIAIVLGGILTAVNWPGWSRFLNPRLC